MKDLDEAIKDCLKAASLNFGAEYMNEQLQLAEWLTELKVRRAIQMSPIYSLSPSIGEIPLTKLQSYECISNNPSN